MVISRITVTATTNRTIGRLATRTSITAWPNSWITRISPTVSRMSSGTAMKTTLPGSVSRLHPRPMTVMRPNYLARRGASRGQGAGEQGSERSPSYVSDPAQPATPASAVPWRAGRPSLIHSAHDRVEDAMTAIVSATKCPGMRTPTD